MVCITYRFCSADSPSTGRVGTLLKLLWDKTLKERYTVRTLSHLKNIVRFEEHCPISITSHFENIAVPFEEHCLISSIVPFEEHCPIWRKLSHFKNIVPLQEHCPISRTLSHFNIMTEGYILSKLTRKVLIHKTLFVWRKSNCKVIINCSTYTVFIVVFELSNNSLWIVDRLFFWRYLQNKQK